MERIKVVPMEDFVGRWIAGNDQHATTTIEIKIVDGHLVVCAIDGSSGELAEIQRLTYGNEEVRFAAQWSSGKTSTYRILLSDGRLVVHVTLSRTDYFKRDLNPDGTYRWRSGILHVAPGHSAGGSLRHAIRSSGRTDDVISFPDNLSCGPIDSQEPSARARWWASIYDEYDVDFDGFWKQIMSTSDRLVVWVGRHSAQEHAFFLALVDRLGDRPYDIIDVTGLQMPLIRPDGKQRLSSPIQAVSLMSETELALLFGTERAMTRQEREEAARRWRSLKSENAPFRIVADSGLVSAPIDVFDELLLERASKDWRKVARVIADTMGHNMEPYIQVGDMMLLTRIVALVDQGKLMAHGDPWLMRKCEVRLPD
ncbi:DUF1835 domain-containing protein [Mesorhizobium sp.]|uniref:DUF1835 domain-containing protein n=1 Tax=Mesorhizobium sp. TaxID=1871066 RepID=UPI000FE37D65|nr:DUF1835 domain-containing protein [Mesorhizobium sp.]RWH74621.1 MAG: DUF1835 domain-containing protein [Mesorhizobium sp.]RWL29557.1 MAG: DUF1835 domain-containing protein [Mesorhizobium sp.]RWL35046.1 MAG: DUF1835 domain-containing protein [Mesorhizobium sp.]RWL38911.1 MAG: DUF1835 domain-containing protein [Mesorhizobium sp.]RWL55035.1 MAG: DUF1835 domain-containing protein [Mesorhizobium sp.]